MSWLTKIFKRKKRGEEEKVEDKDQPSYYVGPDYYHEVTPEREEEMLDQLVDLIVKYRMELPAIMVLEGNKPGCYFMQSMLFMQLSPILDGLGTNQGTDYIRLFQKRENFDRIIRKINERSGYY